MVRGLFCALLGLLLVCLCVGWPLVTEAATYIFHEPTVAVSRPVNFKNGSFETPVTQAPNTHVPQNMAGGWNTVTVDPQNRNKPGANNIQYENVPLMFSMGNWAGFIHSAPDGNQYVELSATYPSRLYQNINVVGRTRYYYQFYHAAWKYLTTGADGGYDVLRFGLRAAGNPGASVTSSQVISTSSVRGSENWVKRTGVFVVPAGMTQAELFFEGTSSWSGNLEQGNELDNVKFQTGASLIMEKSLTNSMGQRIDGGYGEYSDLITVTLKITNWGETDALPCVMTDVLWDGLQFVEGSGTVTGDSGITGNVTCSDDTVTARIGVGATANAGGTIKGSQSMGTSGTTGKGQSVIVTYHARLTGAPGSTIYDQASVSYNDKDFETYNPNGLISYSCVDYNLTDVNNLGNPAFSGSYGMNMLNADGSVRVTYRNVDVSNQETYVNRVTIVDRKLDGKVWYDSNENGMIDQGEEPVVTRVKMQRLVNGTWTDAVDWSGAPLLSTTDGTGRYEFRGIPSGQYRVMAEIAAGGDRVVKHRSGALPTEVTTSTGTQGNYDNDAETAVITDGGTTWAVVQTLDKTGQTYTPTANSRYTHNVDFGFVPVVGIAKGCEIIRSGNTDQGSAAAPVNVLYGDTINYTLTVRDDSGADISAHTFTVTDQLPDGLTYVSSQTPDPLTGTMVSANPTVNGQTLTFSSLPEIPAGGSYAITITTRVTKPNKDIFNTASITEPDGTVTESNKTYHRSHGLDLTISKTVDGDFSDRQQLFTFHINPGYGMSAAELAAFGTTVSPYTGANISGVASVASGTTNAYGSYTTVTLKHGQSITIHDLPVGMEYEIYEDAVGGYTQAVSVTDETVNPGAANVGGYEADTQRTHGTLNSNNSVVAYTNIYEPVARDLTFTKAVTGDKVPEGATFSFDIEVKNADGTPRTGSFEYEAGDSSGTIVLDSTGKGTISGVASGDTVTIHGLSEGDKYIVTESSYTFRGITAGMTSADCWTTTWKDRQRMLISLNGRTPAPVSGYSMWLKSVTSYIDPLRGTNQTETVTDIQAIPEGTPIKVMQVTGSSPNPAVDTDVTSTVGPQLVRTSLDSEGNLVLISGALYSLFNNTAYRDVIGRFYLYIDYSDAVNSGLTTTGMVYTNSGANFENQYTPPLKTLMVTKKVTGELADSRQDFTFSINLKDINDAAETDNYTYKKYTMAGSSPAPASDMTVETGETIADGGTFTLSHRQYIVIDGLPEGEKVTVTELGATDYQTVVTPQNGAAADADVTAKTAGQRSIAGGENDVNRQDFVNTKNSVTPTGVILEYWPYFLLALIALCVGIAVVANSISKGKRGGRRSDRGHGGNAGL